MRDLQKPKLSPDPGSTLLPGVVYFVFQTRRSGDKREVDC